jgi:hypothetical protein
MTAKSLLGCHAVYFGRCTYTTSHFRRRVFKILLKEYKGLNNLFRYLLGEKLDEDEISVHNYKPILKSS